MYRMYRHKVLASKTLYKNIILRYKTKTFCCTSRRWAYIHVLPMYVTFTFFLYRSSFEYFKRSYVFRNVPDIYQYSGVQLLRVHSKDFVLERVQSVGFITFLARVDQF